MIPFGPRARAALEAASEPRLTRVARRFAWPAAIALSGLGWYASESLRHRREGAFGYDLVGDVEVGDPSFLRASEALTGAPISEGNQLELLINGDRIFPALLETIRSAERTLNLEAYVYWRGDVTEQVAEAICERARAGVRCRVLLDAVGSAPMNRGLIRTMEGAGVVFRRFRPPKPYAIKRVANRSHRRVLVVDGRVGMTGGVGIAEEWTGDAQDPDHWRDTHLRIRGPVVRGLQGAFAEHWLEATGEVLGGPDMLPELERFDDGSPMQLVRSRSGVGDTNAEALYYLAIASARNRLELTAAYFVPRPAFVGALCEAARRGVEVRVLVPGPHVDKPFMRTAGRAQYDSLLDCGVRIFEYEPTMLHAKTLVVDGAWSSVGSINFDNRSFQLNDELTLGVWSEHVAGLLSEQFAADVDRANEIEAGRWTRRGVRERSAEAAVTLVRREL